MLAMAFMLYSSPAILLMGGLCCSPVCEASDDVTAGGIRPCTPGFHLISIVMNLLLVSSGVHIMSQACQHKDGRLVHVTSVCGISLNRVFPPGTIGYSILKMAAFMQLQPLSSHMCLLNRQNVRMLEHNQYCAVQSHD